MNSQPVASVGKRLFRLRSCSIDFSASGVLVSFLACLNPCPGSSLPVKNPMRSERPTIAMHLSIVKILEASADK